MNAPPTESDEFIAKVLVLQQTLAAAQTDAKNLNEALAAALVLALNAVGSTSGRLVLLDAQRESAVVWSVEDGKIASLSVADDPTEIARLERLVLLHCEPAVVDVPPKEGDSQKGKLFSTSQSLSVPLRNDDQILGFLAAHGMGQGEFTFLEHQRLVLCAGIMAQAVALTGAETRLVDLERLRNELAAMLVHDLQGPLGNIVAGLEMAQPLWQVSEARPLLDIALHSGYQLRALVDSALDITRLETGQPIPSREPLTAEQLIDSTLAVIMPEFEVRNIRPVVEIEPDPPAVLANQGMMLRVLLNLLDNALKASHSGQTIHVRARRDAQRPFLLFSVADQGRGIPPAFRELVFEKFQRVDSIGASKGLGLGLAYCRLAVNAHGGDIWVEDNPEGGASFFFTLPLVEVTEK